MSCRDTMQKREIIMTRKVCIESNIYDTIDGNIGWYSKKWTKEIGMTHPMYSINNNPRWINIDFSYNIISTIHTIFKGVITPA